MSNPEDPSDKGLFFTALQGYIPFLLRGNIWLEQQLQMFSKPGRLSPILSADILTTE